MHTLHVSCDIFHAMDWILPPSEYESGSIHHVGIPYTQPILNKVYTSGDSHMKY